MDTKKFKVIFLPLLITNLLGCVYYECPFKNLSDEQQEKHLTMMKNIFAQQKQNDTKNNFSVQIKIYTTTSIQEVVNKTYTSSSEEPENAIKILQNLWKDETIRATPIENVKNFHKKLIESNNEIFNTLPTKTYIQNHSNLRTIDSEFQFFADFFAQDMLLRLTERDEITRIEIHGFTTRDMCPCCFTHMGLFYDRLKEALNGPASVNEDSLFYNFIQQIKPFLTQGTPVQLAFYISSSIQLGLQEFDGSIYPSYAGTTYNNSVKNITKFYTLKKQSEGESPTEGIFCTFIRDDNPNWSLQYYTKNDNSEIKVESRQFSFLKNQYECMKNGACTVQCSKNSEHVLTEIAQANNIIILKCEQGENQKEKRNQKVSLTTQASTNNINLFRNLVSSWITQEVFSFAKGKAASF